MRKLKKYEFNFALDYTSLVAKTTEQALRLQELPSMSFMKLYFDLWKPGQITIKGDEAVLTAESQWGVSIRRSVAEGDSFDHIMRVKADIHDFNYMDRYGEGQGIAVAKADNDFGPDYFFLTDGEPVGEYSSEYRDGFSSQQFKGVYYRPIYMTRYGVGEDGMFTPIAATIIKHPA